MNSIFSDVMVWVALYTGADDKIGNRWSHRESRFKPKSETIFFFVLFCLGWDDLGEWHSNMYTIM